jgi:hypothetical protein
LPGPPRAARAAPSLGAAPARRGGLMGACQVCEPAACPAGADRSPTVRARLKKKPVATVPATNQAAAGPPPPRRAPARACALAPRAPAPLAGGAWARVMYPLPPSDMTMDRAPRRTYPPVPSQTLHAAPRAKTFRGAPPRPPPLPRAAAAPAAARRPPALPGRASPPNAACTRPGPAAAAPAGARPARRGTPNALCARPRRGPRPPSPQAPVLPVPGRPSQLTARLGSGSPRHRPTPPAPGGAGPAPSQKRFFQPASATRGARHAARALLMGSAPRSPPRASSTGTHC